MKAVLKIIVSALLFHSIYAQAESEIRMRGIETRVKNLETQKSKHYEPITPNAGPKVQNGLDLYLVAEFLYWTARLDTLTYAKSGIGNVNTNLSPSKGNIHSVDWQWDPGFKVGMGWTFCHGGWDMQLKYTWFYTNVGDSKEGRSLYPGFAIDAPGFLFSVLPLRRAHAHWDLHYQTGDWEIGRNYLVNRYLKFRPFIGVKGTWQKQDYRAFFESVQVTAQQGIQAAFDVKAKFDHSLWGFGMRTGVNASWQFTDWFCLYGDFALTGMWLHYDIDRRDTFTVVSSTQPLADFSPVNMQDVLRNVKPVFEFGFGLRLETYFDCNRFHILFQAGWEAQIWPSQTFYISLNDNYDRFDLNLHGLTVKGRFDF